MATQLRRCCNDWHHMDKHQKSRAHRSRKAQTQAEMFSLPAPHLIWDAEVPIIFLTPEVVFFSYFCQFIEKHLSLSLFATEWMVRSLPCPLKFTHYFQPTPPHKNLLKTATAEHFLQHQPNSNLPTTFYLSLITDAEILQRCQTYLYHCHSSLLAQQSQMCIFPLCQKASCADKH